MFYLTTYILLTVYDVRHIVKGHSDNNRKTLLPPLRLATKDFYIYHPTSRFVCYCFTPVVGHWVERGTPEWIHPYTQHCFNMFHN